MEIKPIAKIITDFPDKFGIPRQSRRISGLIGEIVFEKEYSSEDFIRGIEEYSHIWLIWGFSENTDKSVHATVRPPRLGGNTRVGVFATRSPFRPNHLGISCVELLGTQKREGKTVLKISGADMMSGTPIYDIKPYIAYSDSVADAISGFAEKEKDYRLEVEVPQELLSKLPYDKQNTLIEILADDPRPSYQNDEQRIYGFRFAGYEIKFRVQSKKAIVCAAEPLEQTDK